MISKQERKGGEKMKDKDNIIYNMTMLFLALYSLVCSVGYTISKDINLLFISALFIILFWYSIYKYEVEKAKRK